MIKEGEEITKSIEEDSVIMGHDKAADLLEQTLQEEEDTDYNLTEIAETNINFGAQQED